MLVIFYYIDRLEIAMELFFPFIHQIEKKKKELEQIPLYVELYPPPQKEKEEEKDENNSTVIIIQL
jgi:hypothetical protein